MDTRTISRLAGIMVQYNLTDLDVEEAGLHVKLGRSGQAAAAVPCVPELPEASAELNDGAIEAEPEKERVAECRGEVVVSPLVGTFYVSSTPDGEAFVHEGSTVRVGQTLCIIEAMKVMNEVKAEKAGVITKVCLGNKTPVEYGTALFEIQVD